MEEKDLVQFREFARGMSKPVHTPQSKDSYKNRWGKNNSPVDDNYTKEKITKIIQSGDTAALRELSRYFSRYSGIYARIKQYYSSLLNYQFIVVPHYDLKNPPKKLVSIYNKVSKYVKDMNLDHICPQINNAIFEEGIFYGILKDSEKNKPIFYHLPEEYCRTRFNDENGLPILELDVNYFGRVIQNEKDINAALKLFPKQVAQAYHRLSDLSKIGGNWIEIPPQDGGMVFFFNEDHVPPFVAASESLADLQDARAREGQRDTNELYKLLIQKMPIDKSNGNLLFSLDEAAIIHDSVGEMLQDIPTIDLLTTYADVKLENVQDASEAASAATNRIQKYVASAYNEFGTTKEIFNSTNGSTAITYSIKKDISLIYGWSKQFEIWVNIWLRAKAKNDQLYFSVRLLPTSYLFRKDDIDTYLKTAQYGYPKATVAAALGFDLVDLVSLCDFENNILNLKSVMIPLSSSYTESSDSSGDSGGRPTKSVEERSDSTNDNIDGAT